MARDFGVGARGIRQLVRAGGLLHVRRGVYQRPGPTTTSTVTDLVLATAPLLAPGTVISHTSAALLHGLPTEAALCHRVWTIRTRSHGGPSGVVRASDARVSDDEVVEIRGVPVTSLARTVIDLARTRPFDWGVAVADAALRHGLTREELEDAAVRAAGVPGIVRGRSVVRFADVRSESVGESRSRALMRQQGLPDPELQEEVWFGGVLVGRPDFRWRDHRTVGEFDGKAKYGALVPSGRTAADVIMAEKDREERFREAGWWVVRWGWHDLADASALALRIRRAFGHATR